MSAFVVYPSCCSISQLSLGATPECLGTYSYQNQSRQKEKEKKLYGSDQKIFRRLTTNVYHVSHVPPCIANLTTMWTKLICGHIWLAQQARYWKLRYTE